MAPPDTKNQQRTKPRVLFYHNIPTPTVPWMPEKAFQAGCRTTANPLQFPGIQFMFP
jgi:hypothetical protein